MSSCRFFRCMSAACLLLLCGGSFPQQNAFQSRGVTTGVAAYAISAHSEERQLGSNCAATADDQTAAASCLFEDKPSTKLEQASSQYGRIPTDQPDGSHLESSTAGSSTAPSGSPVAPFLMRRLQNVVGDRFGSPATAAGTDFGSGEAWPFSTSHTSGDAAVRQLQALVSEPQHELVAESLEGLSYEELNNALDSLLEEDFGDISELFSDEALNDIAKDIANSASQQPPLSGTDYTAAAFQAEATTPQSAMESAIDQSSTMPFYYSYYNQQQEDGFGGGSGRVDGSVQKQVEVVDSSVPPAAMFNHPSATAQMLLRGNSGYGGSVFSPQAMSSAFVASQPTRQSIGMPSPITNMSPPPTYPAGGATALHFPLISLPAGPLSNHPSTPYNQAPSHNQGAGVVGLLEGFGDPQRVGVDTASSSSTNSLVAGSAGGAASALGGLGGVGSALIGHPSSSSSTSGGRSVMRNGVGANVQASLRNGAANALGLGSAVASAGAAGLVELSSALQLGSDSARSAVARQAPLLASQLAAFGI